MNILQEIALFIKLRKQLKNFDMKNWKTSLSGILAFVPSILHLLLPKYVSTETALHLTAILTGTGLIAASDSKVDLNK